jgi:nicotinamidase-related amidase
MILLGAHMPLLARLGLLTCRYADGLLTTVDVKSTRAAISSLLETYRSASASIIHVVHDTPSGAPVFTPGTPLAAEFEELTPRDGEPVVHKQHPGSFTGTDLQDLIQKTGKNQLVIVGYMAHICVSTTTRQAAEKGYDVILAKEAIGDRDIPGTDGAKLVEVVLNELADGFGTVVSVKDIK